MFIAACLLFPENAIAYFGILGGIGLGLSVSYGWQTAFNAFTSLAIATPSFGIAYAVLLRIFHNVFSAVFTWIFDRIFEPALSACNHIFAFAKPIKKTPSSITM